MFTEHTLGRGALQGRSSDERDLAGGVETRLDVGPVDDVPEGLDVVGLDVLVLQVEGVLPHVQHEQRVRAEGDVALLVVELLDDQTLTEHVPGDRKSTRLNSSHVAISYAVFCLE